MSHLVPPMRTEYFLQQLHTTGTPSPIVVKSYKNFKLIAQRGAVGQWKNETCQSESKIWCAHASRYMWSKSSFPHVCGFWGLWNIASICSTSKLCEHDAGERSVLWYWTTYDLTLVTSDCKAYQELSRGVKTVN